MKKNRKIPQKFNIFNFIDRAKFGTLIFTLAVILTIVGQAIPRFLIFFWMGLAILAFYFVYLVIWIWFTVKGY